MDFEGCNMDRDGILDDWIKDEELEAYYQDGQWNMDGTGANELEIHCKLWLQSPVARWMVEQEDTISRPPGVCGIWAWVSPTGKVTRFLCGSRRCERTACKGIFGWRRVRLLAELVEQYKLRFFYTLTLDPKNFVSDEDSWNRIPGVWNKFRTIITRKYPDFKYCSVLEKHRKNGRPHIHGFCSLFIEWEEWKHHWSECGGGQGVWLEKVQHTQTVSQYVAKSIDVCKYVSKDALSDVPPENRKTFWRSKGMKSERELTKSVTWDIIKDGVFDSTGRQLMFLSGGGNDGEQLASRNHSSVDTASSS